MPRPAKDARSKATTISIANRDLKRLDALLDVDPRAGAYAVAQARRRYLAALLDQAENAVELEHIRETARFAAPVCKLLFKLPVENGDVDGVVQHFIGLPPDERAALVAKVRETFGLPEGKAYGDGN